MTFPRLTDSKRTQFSNADPPMALVVAAKFNVTRALHPLKAESPIDSNALELVRTTLERFSQPSNAETPMVFNPATDVNSLSALHPLNVELAIAITPDGRAKETSDSQDLNADAPISVTLVIEVVFNALHELNADSPIL